MNIDHINSDEISDVQVSKRENLVRIIFNEKGSPFEDFQCEDNNSFDELIENLRKLIRQKENIDDRIIFDIDCTDESGIFSKEAYDKAAKKEAGMKEWSTPDDAQRDFLWCLHDLHEKLKTSEKELMPICKEFSRLFAKINAQEKLPEDFVDSSRLIIRCFASINDFRHEAEKFYMASCTRFLKG